MLKNRPFDLLRREIEANIASLNGSVAFQRLLKECLATSKRGLATGSAQGKPWPLLPLMVCEAISGYFERALPSAATMQFFMAAADVFDDIEDGDSVASLAARHGAGVATNVATALIILAEKSVARLERGGVPAHTIVRVVDVVNSFYSTACVGQHLDLSLSCKTAISEEEFLKVSYMKSASTVECACYIGALMATEDPGMIDTFARFGHNLGIASQIANDILGITNGSDLAKQKVTLPVIYALAQTDGETRNRLEQAFEGPPGGVLHVAEIRDLLFRTGAIHYAAVRMECYRQQALDVLHEAESAGASIEPLKTFLQ